MALIDLSPLHRNCEPRARIHGRLTARCTCESAAELLACANRCNTPRRLAFTCTRVHASVRACVNAYTAYSAGLWNDRDRVLSIDFLEYVPFSVMPVACFDGKRSKEANSREFVRELLRSLGGRAGGRFWWNGFMVRSWPRT